MNAILPILDGQKFIKLCSRYWKLHGLSPWVNYTDRATVASNFVDRGCHMVSMTDPYGRILGSLDWVQDIYQIKIY
jgi:hypothetical protein